MCPLQPKKGWVCSMNRVMAGDPTWRPSEQMSMPRSAGGPWTSQMLRRISSSERVDPNVRKTESRWNSAVNPHRLKPAEA
jgi:hypothetical protein